MTDPRADGSKVDGQVTATDSPQRHYARRPAAMPPSNWALRDATEADEDGVVGIGADLAPSTLVDAYRRGIFPWPHPDTPLPWCSPDPRGVLLPERLSVSRSLVRTLRRCGWTTTVDAAFDEVVAACAVGDDREPTWILPSMREAYGQLHALGWAHSVEVWDGFDLVGGLYGVQIGGIFTGESMFHRRTDASKVALVDIVDRLVEAGGRYLDVQLVTPHLASLGAIDRPRAVFLEDLQRWGGDAVRLTIDRRPVDRLVAWRHAVGHNGGQASESGPAFQRSALPRER